jgi:uncharacterized OsmC-like protein
MVRMSMVYQGGLRCEARHEPSGSVLETDAPADNHGRAERFSPTDLVGASLASCMATIMGILADREGWDLRGMRADIEKDMTTQPPRRIARLDLMFHMPSTIPESGRARLEQAARACPVLRSLHPDLVVNAEFRWPR